VLIVAVGSPVVKEKIAGMWKKLASAKARREVA
jgi:Flp pilus assembly pilin Flp